MTGAVANEIVPTNNNWFEPQSLKSCLTKSYGQKVMAQTTVDGTIQVTAEFFSIIESDNTADNFNPKDVFKMSHKEILEMLAG